MKKTILFAAAYCLVSLTAACLLGQGSFETFAESFSPLNVNIVLALCAVFCSFIFGFVTGDYSWVDRLWSTLPVVFAWVYAAGSGGSLPVCLLTVMITLWGLRLTYNFARKGGYSGTEDYRWPILKAKMPSAAAWQLFNLLFICVFQIGLFIMFTLPLHFLLEAGSTDVSGIYTPVAYIVMLLMPAVLMLETKADQQQWEFQQDKINRGKGKYAACVQQGFLSAGLYNRSRHPNYFAELTFWWLVYLCCALLAGQIINASIMGAILLTFLFAGSTRFTESITAAKYPAYEEYQRNTSAIIPRRRK